MPADKFYPTPLPELLKIILNQYYRHGSILGIPGQLFFKPQASDPFRTVRYSQLLETPIGVAAGPHTQLSQNIVAAWLTGARFIELKTIQTLDELEVSKPCIDMQDEGYNCEWSQELKVEQSFNQYLDAWIIIHVLKDFLNIGTPNEPGFIFNMSVGYNLNGILQPNVQWFFAKMQDATLEMQAKIDSIVGIYSRVKVLNISPRISDNVTLSTMHGCPPEEIEKIGEYLLRVKGLHTSIKLNPTLLGETALREILENSGFETQVPGIAFEHDLKYHDALKIISNLSEIAKNPGLQFSIKLTNTLESVNHKKVFPPDEKMMYMSGRALHPVSVGIANKLQKDFGGALDISFCGGADAFNISNLVACGLSPVTVCTDLLKPGGFTRLHQYIEQLRMECGRLKADTTDDFIIKKSENKSQDAVTASLQNLAHYSVEVRNASDYKKASLRDPGIKTLRPLGWFDCIHAPCEDTCPTNQDIPAYNYYTANGDFTKAAEVINQTNPFPQTTGMICDHLCQLKCTRINYDHPVLIREIKRFVAEQAIGNMIGDLDQRGRKNIDKKVVIIGAGPSGLSCANFLIQAGFHVGVFETKVRPGGMVSSGIPSFRLTNQALENDVKKIESLGVKINYEQEIDRSLFEKLRQDYDYVYIAAGAQQSVKLNLDGIEKDHCTDPLIFLEDLKEGKPVSIGKNIVIIGGGNTAMDVARTAFRLVGEDGKVTILYRRTVKEMPADMGEIEAVMEEGIEIMELAAPVRIYTKNGKAHSITCVRMKLGNEDASGRPHPVIIPGSEFDVIADTIIPAIGQELAFDFGDKVLLRSFPGSYETQIPGVFIGGDAMRGASTAINAIGDGRKVAQEIIDRENVLFRTKPENNRPTRELNWHMSQRAKRIRPVQTREIPIEERRSFNLVSSALTREEAIYEASRCLLCDEVCNICTTVCPNLAFFSSDVEPMSIKMQKLVQSNGIWLVTDDKDFIISQPYQILHIADWCNNCGNCNTFCPSADAPYQVKPHLFLSKEAFETEKEGFYLENVNDHTVLLHKQNGIHSKLTALNDDLIYEFGGNKIFLNKSGLHITGFEIADDENKEIKLITAVRMYVIMQGANKFFG